MQCAERRQRNLRGAHLETGAIDRVELPPRQYRHGARRQFHVHELTRTALLALNAARAPPEQWMPTIVDHDILPDMGRMTARLHLEEKIRYSVAAKAAPSLAIPSFFEIKESDGGRKLSKKTRILFFRSPR
jgi:hypothetical protein